MSQLIVPSLSEGALKQGEKLLEKVFNSIHVLLAYMDREFNFIRVNDKYAAADNRDPAFFTGKNHFALYPNPENEVIFRRVVETGVPHFVYEKAFVYADHPERGTTYWDWSLEPVFGASGVDGLVLSLIDVTQRVRAREEVRGALEALRAAQAELVEAQRLAHIGSWRWDIATNAVHWSDEAYRIYGFEPQSFSPRLQNVLDIAHPDDRPRLQEYIDSMRSLGEPRSIEHRIVRPDGSVRHVHRRAEVVRDEKREPVAVRGTVQDITERKIAEDALARREQQFRNMLEAWPDIVARFDKDLRHEYVSPAIEKITGRPPQDFVGKSNREMGMPEENLRAWEENVRSVFETGVARSADFTFTGPAGTFSFEWRLVPERGADGSVQKVLTLARDVTERRIAEEKLRRSEERFRAMAETIDDVFWISTPGIEKMLYISPAYEKIWGRSCASLYEKPQSFVDAVHPDDVPRLSSMFENHRRGVAYELEYRIVRPDGAVRWMHERGFPVRDARGDVHTMTGVVSDITERKLAEEQLRHSEAALAEAQRIALLGNWEWDIAKGTLHWSDEIYRMFGQSPQQFPATYEAFLDAIHPDDRGTVSDAVNAALHKHKQYAIDHRIIVPTVGIRHVHEQGEVTFDDGQRPVRMIGTVQDITERKLAELAQRKINRALKTLSRCNETLIHARDEAELLHDMCRTLVEEGGYRAASVAFLGDGGPQNPVAQVGFTEPLTRADLVCTAGAVHPACEAAGTGEPRVLRDLEGNREFAPWQEHARRNTYRSLLALPLSWNHSSPSGSLIIYAIEADAFDAEELALLKELAADLCYGISALRTREASERTQKQLQKSMERTVHAVASTVEMRDPYTAGHQRRVAELAAAIGKELRLTEGETTALRMAGAVHDIGKVYVPAEILNRPGALSDLEMTLVKTHVHVGYDILKDVEFPWPVADMVHQHHERLDGSGYPRGLRGDQITLGARILAVADVVEAMASHRPYRPALGLTEALDEIKNHRGTRYDSAVVDACLALFRENRFQFATTWR